MELYYKYTDYLIKKYGAKTYKLPINLPVTCPNRDGNLGKNGCAFCGEKAAGFEILSDAISVENQLLENKEYMGDRFNAEKFIAYFQNFTNTYLPLTHLRKFIAEAVQVDDIVAINLSTRPDCINEEYLEGVLAEIEDKNPLVELGLEIGLQTVNYHTLEEVQRGHTLAEFIDAVLMAKKYDLEVSVHLIPNLPGDNLLDVRENARILSALGVDTVKLHALYIRENSLFGKKYAEGELEITSLDDYIERIILFLENLDPSIAVQRLLGRAPGKETLFENWDLHWTKIQNKILAEMKKRETYQGKKFDYLSGKALKGFTQ